MWYSSTVIYITYICALVSIYDLDVLKTLHSAQIRTVMVTGDNVLTALSVARECNIIKPNLPVLLAKTTPPSDDYDIIGKSSGSPPTLLWEEAQEVDNAMMLVWNNFL